VLSVEYELNILQLFAAKALFTFLPPLITYNSALPITLPSLLPNALPSLHLTFAIRTRGQ
jgi:hypothetical protein